jgi:16S rRNA (cytidine1402-2'-O)-methyltransferase
MERTTVLYLVPTPIGNLADMTYRAVQVLSEVDLILAEDTRTSGKLLKHYEIGTPMQSFHAHNEHKKVEYVLEQLESGKKLALISDAGTPGISDPGFLLVRAAVEKGFGVECLPGATAFVPAIVKSGIPSDRFLFEGFLPHKKGRQTRIKEISEETRTVVLYESPHRVLKTLEQLLEFCEEDRLVSVSRELTKKFEETLTLPLKEMADHFRQHAPKGEFVMIIAGKEKK